MLNNIHQSFKLLSSGPPATAEQIKSLVDHFGWAPTEYLDLISEATELEFQNDNGKYVRIWGAAGCIEMDEGYGIRANLPGAIPVGDNGGGDVIFYAQGNQGNGIYCVGYGDLALEDARWVAATLRDLLTQAEGVNEV